MAQKTRDGLRAALLGTKKIKTEIINIFDQDVEIKQPTIGKMSAMAKKSENSKVSPLVMMLIEYCYVPGTNDKVFEDGDAAALSELPTGKWLNDLNQCIERLTGLGVAVAEKNSEPTASE